MITSHSGRSNSGKGEHLLRFGGTAGDSFVGFDGIFERNQVHNSLRTPQGVRSNALPRPPRMQLSPHA